ncbi:pilus (MSHA type) biogenesis protein MshL [Sedimenticola selenatireducens]|uniref:Pilus (MSHA type) biogenesis protein MshL n=1 Tax=Sedimenticola selenatireducens TaxID=191960 RepID=A0A2N6D1V0_9GAMM|nr:pilus (MSHA type) biogenesis protein MshL [Sedimenticola selenatireducens]PLX63653.1 MAG: pilus (MSHA type) biogenesis protein MshL [Sedimenticola selenatireducens]
MSLFRCVIRSPLLVLSLLLLSGCQSMAPKDGGTMEKIQDDLKTPPPSEAKPVSLPPPAVAAALLPPVDMQLPRAGKRAQEARFDVNVSEVPVRAFLMGLVEGTPYNMVVHPQVDGTLSLSLKQVTIPDVMEMLRDVYGYEYQRVRSGFHVLPARLQSRIFQVNYLNLKRTGSSQTRVSSGQVTGGGSDGEESGSGSSSSGVTSGSEINTTSEADFWTELSGAIQSIVGSGTDRSVVVSPQSGLVVVRAMPHELREVEAFLETTNEAMHRQVILEAKVIEVELNDGYQAGINWAKMMTVDGKKFSFGQTGGSSLFTTPDKAGVELPQGGISSPTEASPVSFTSFSAFGGLFGAALNTGSFMAFIELLESQGNVQVLSSPRISTLNNQKAVIKVGSDEFFVTDVSSTTTTGTATTTTPDITLTPFFSGIALDVTPQIDRQGRVTLHIHPSVSQVTDQQKVIQVGNETQNLPLAKSTVRESDSLVYAESGQLVVIGGLMQDTRGEEVASTPVLGDLPLLGQLFRHTRQAAKKSELVIVLRPTVVESTETWRARVSDAADRFRQLDRGFHYGSQPGVFGNLGEKTE